MIYSKSKEETSKSSEQHDLESLLLKPNKSERDIIVIIFIVIIIIIIIIIIIFFFNWHNPASQNTVTSF